MRDRFLHCLVKLAQQDQRIWLLTGDLGYNVLEDFQHKFPDRYVNCGIAEQTMTGVAAGLALAGKIPFIYSIANFSTLRCLEQIRNDITYHHLKVNIIGVGGGLAYGNAGYTHHALEDLAVMQSLPDMTVFSPADPHEVEALMPMVMASDGACYMRMGKGGEQTFHPEPPGIDPAKPLIIRPGDDIALLTCGALLAEAVEVSDKLAKNGPSIRVLSAPVPGSLDPEAVMDSLGAIRSLVILEEHMGRSPFGALIEKGAMHLANAGISLDRFNLPPEVRHVVGERRFLLEKFGLAGGALEERLNNLFREKKSGKSSKK